MRCLTSYARASGQFICWPNARIIFSPNVPVNRKHQIIQELGVTYNGRKDKYLGIPFLFGRKKIDSFDDLITRTSSCINAWYNRFLSTAGCTVLIQSVTSVIPTYAMSVAP